MKKRITDERRKHLLILLELAAEKIAIGNKYCICHAMYALILDSNDESITDRDWMSLPEAKMIEPSMLKDEVIANGYNHYSFWWGVKTMGTDLKTNPNEKSPEARQARLLGIAMMLTLPDDMINEEFLIEPNTYNVSYNEKLKK